MGQYMMQQHEQHHQNNKPSHHHHTTTSHLHVGMLWSHTKPNLTACNIKLRRQSEATNKLIAIDQFAPLRSLRNSNTISTFTVPRVLLKLLLSNSKKLHSVHSQQHQAEIDKGNEGQVDLTEELMEGVQVF